MLQLVRRGLCSGRVRLVSEPDTRLQVLDGVIVHGFLQWRHRTVVSRVVELLYFNPSSNYWSVPRMALRYVYKFDVHGPPKGCGNGTRQFQPGLRSAG